MTCHHHHYHHHHHHHHHHHLVANTGPQLFGLPRASAAWSCHSYTSGTWLRRCSFPIECT
eukprot:1153010-Pelagomonas_calceolata.AAC.4